MKYVTKRVSGNSTRWYWQRTGHPLTRLPNDETEREAMAAKLNKRADELKALATDPGSAAGADWKRFWKSLKVKSASRGIGFDLPWTAFVEIVRRSRGKCEVTGIPLTLKVGRGERSPYQASLDRINSGEPYTATNCRLVCLAANIALNEWGDDILREVSRGVLTEYLKRTKAA